MKRKIILFLFIALAQFTASAQCAMCRAVLESEQGHSAAKGINDGIVYLMSVPYVLVAGIGIFIYRKYRTR